MNSLLRTLEQSVPELAPMFRFPLAGANWSGLYVHEVLADEIAAIKDLELGNEWIALAIFLHTSRPQFATWQSAPGTKGEREGFIHHDYRASTQISRSEIQHYVNLAQLFKDQNTGRIDMGAFFSSYGIAHHESSITEALRRPEFLQLLEQICKELEVLEYTNSIRETAVNLDEVASLAADQDELAFDVAMKGHLNSLEWSNDWITALSLFRGMGNIKEWWLKTEEHRSPELSERRKEHQRLASARSFKQILEEAGLLKEEVFDLCDVMYGSARGEFMKDLRAAVQSTEDIHADFEPIQDRILHARKLLTALTETEKLGL